MKRDSSLAGGDAIGSFIFDYKLLIAREGIEMTYEQIRYENKKNIVVITLNRPEKLNAWTYVIARELRDALYKAEADESVRVVVLTGAGRGFCSGADISELQSAPDRGVDKSGQTLSPEQQVSVLMMTKTEEELDPENAKDNRDDFRRRFSYFLGLQKPVIAAINGPCLGLGLIITLFCDIRFASEKAKFSTAFSKRGLIAEHGISWILPRIAGISNALDMLFSSRLIEAEEAFKMGLVNRVFPEENFMESVMAYASDLANTVSPRSMRIMKRQVYNAIFQSLAEAWAVADEEMLSSFQSEDFKEGISHFLEKRSPKFTGK